MRFICRFTFVCMRSLHFFLLFFHYNTVVSDLFSLDRLAFHLSLLAWHSFLFISFIKSKYVCSRTSFRIDNTPQLDTKFAFDLFFISIASNEFLFSFLAFVIGNISVFNLNALMYRKWRWWVEDMNLWMRLNGNLCFFTNILWFQLVRCFSEK